MSLPLVLALGLLAGPRPAGPAPAAIAWQEWTDDVFPRAQREKRFVLLDLGAVWCHWCHVMDETTYRDPRVVRLIGQRFLAVKVDQDARPDLSSRYEDYGWPATIVFDPSGAEIVKFRGYIEPGRMASMLQDVIDDPTPGPSVRRTQAAPATPAAGRLTEEHRRELLAGWQARYDREHGGWGFSHKFLDWDSVEYALERARRGDAEAARMARETLDAERSLIDPVWGGVYQYSDSGVWTNPHFEKIVSFQAETLRVYARAYAQWHEERDLAAARDIHRYLRGFLRGPQGSFYVSQDADVVRGQHSAGYFSLGDAERRRRGVPRVDTHLYARENGWVVQALVALYEATGDDAVLEEALTAARWIVAERSLAAGGFRHDARDEAGPFLGDTLAPARGFLALYAATGDRAWLVRAEEAAGFLEAAFVRDGVAGLVTARAAVLPSAPQRDENIAVARFANLLARFTGRDEHRRLAERAMGYLGHPDVAARFETAGVLLADEEMSAAPVHLGVVGPREDPRTRALVEAALAVPTAYKRVEVWDPAEGPFPNADVDYPRIEAPAAYVCGERRCSPPAASAEDLRALLEKREAARAATP
jgi:uncharacterized protein YyaL (SSP411 family)